MHPWSCIKFLNCFVLKCRLFIAEMRRAQAHLYERVVRGDSDIELLFQKYKDLLDMQITMGK